MTDPVNVLQGTPSGSAVYRSHLVRVRLLAAALVAAAVAVALVIVIGHQAAELHAAADRMERLNEQRAAQQRRLDALERQAQSLQRLDVQSQRSIEKIERTLGQRHARAALPGDAPARAAAGGRTKSARDVALGERLRSLAAATRATQARTAELARLARRVLNLRRLASIARSRMIAAIPSLNPVDGAINAAFGWRTNPWPEFHKGLDLAADYGTVVRAAADGTVVSAGWEGGFGIKIDIDHRNGYHTWYCHLARAQVRPGQHVARGNRSQAWGRRGNRRVHISITRSCTTASRSIRSRF